MHGNSGKNTEVMSTLHSEFRRGDNSYNEVLDSMSKFHTDYRECIVEILPHTQNMHTQHKGTTVPQALRRLQC
eukprot:6468797-Amphidinium_carterae.1